MKIKLFEKQTETVTTNTYTLTIDDKTYIWIDYVNDNGFVIDSTFRDDDGNEISMLDVDMTDKVQRFIDKVENKK